MVWTADQHKHTGSVGRLLQIFRTTYVNTFCICCSKVMGFINLNTSKHGCQFIVKTGRDQTYPYTDTIF